MPEKLLCPMIYDIIDPINNFVFNPVYKFVMQSVRCSSTEENSTHSVISYPSKSNIKKMKICDYNVKLKIIIHEQSNLACFGGGQNDS